MKIASQTTWGIRCGVAEYARNLNKCLRDEGVEVVIYGNIPSEKGIQDHLVVPDDEDFEVERNWSVEGWSGISTHPIVNGTVPPLLHVQYESFLYSMKWFPSFIQRLKAHDHKIVITYHSASVPPGFPRECIDLAICHTSAIERSVPGKQKMSLEMPTVYSQPRVGTFGLGRVHRPWLEQACQELDWELQDWCSDRGGPWLPQDQLIALLRCCDVIALPYPPVGTSVSSSAAKVALAANRPLVLSRVNWFSTIPEDVAFKHDWDYESFKAALQRALPNVDYVKQRSWQRAAHQHLKAYEELLK